MFWLHDYAQMITRRGFIGGISALLAAAVGGFRRVPALRGLAVVGGSLDDAAFFSWLNKHTHSTVPGPSSPIVGMDATAGPDMTVVSRFEATSSGQFRFVDGMIVRESETYEFSVDADGKMTSRVVEKARELVGFVSDSDDKARRARSRELIKQLGKAERPALNEPAAEILAREDQIMNESLEMIRRSGPSGGPQKDIIVLDGNIVRFNCMDGVYVVHDDSKA